MDTEFVTNPVHFLLRECIKPVVDLDLFVPGQTVPVISGAGVNKFVYSNADLWDYSLGRQAFRTAFGDRYITLLSGVEYHEKQRQFQHELRVGLDEVRLKEIVEARISNRHYFSLADWARGLSICLLWTALHPCYPVPLGLLDEYEEHFQQGAGLPSDAAMVHYGTTAYDELTCDLHTILKMSGSYDFVATITPFIAGIRALSTAIEWLVLGRLQSPPADLPTILRTRPAFVLFPLYPSRDFELWNTIGPNARYLHPFKKGELIFHALTVPQMQDIKQPLALFGGGVHKCPGRHLVRRLLSIVLWELSMVDDLSLIGGEGVMDAKFNGLLVPKYDWRFE